jgi:hypothetical protein
MPRLLSTSRAIALGIALALAPPWAFGDPDSLDDQTLSAKEVARYFTPYVPEVRACYVANAHTKAASGVLRLELVIHSNGSIFRFGFSAPGVVPPWLARLDGCLRERSATWHFPVRKGFTSAVLPFEFVKTDAPGAGPIEKGQP